MGSFYLSTLYQEYLRKTQLLDPGQVNFATSAHSPMPGQGSLPTGIARTSMYYSSGFLGAGSNQTSLGGTLLSGVLGGLESIFHFPTAVTPSVRTPATLPSDTTTANQHPVLTGAGSASGNAGRTATAVGVGTAIAGGVAGVLAPGLVGLGGAHRARYAPAGTKGYHMIKKGPHAGMWARNRHRNVANIRALRRALSRAHGFERICRKVMHFVSPHKSRGRPVFRRRRRK